MWRVVFICGFIGSVASSCKSEDPTPDTESSASSPPAHATPYAVGSTTRFIHDTSRPYDEVAGIDYGTRILITEVWYPVDHATAESKKYRSATYGDYVFGNREVHQLMMTQTTFFHLTPDTVVPGVSQAQIDAAIDELFERQRGSFVDAPLASSDSPWPVVVMSHGDAGSRYNMESACEYLAAHGYVVIAPEHTGNSPYSMTAEDPALAASNGNPEIIDSMTDVLASFGDNGVYGDTERWGQSYSPLTPDRGSVEYFKYMDRSFLQRVNDLRATLRELDDMNVTGPFAQHLDLSRIGLMGRSFGGATTLVGLALEDRFTSGFAVVPPSMPNLTKILPVEMLAQGDQESALLSTTSPFGLAEITKPTFILSGAEDTLIIGLAANMAQSLGSTAPSSDNPHPILRQAYESTQSPVVWGLLADSNHASFGVSGGYWWPDLKPQQQNRHFAPEETFDLVDVNLAHQIQREKALAFFDYTIRQDETARARLIDAQYAINGLTLEARNLQ